GRLAPRVVEARAGDVDPRGAALEVVPAAAFLEAAAGHPQVAVIAGVDRMGAAARALARAEPGEGRAVDDDPRAGVVAGGDALLAVAEPGFGDQQVASLEADAGAVEIGHAHVLEHQARDFRPAPAQHQRGLALAG